MYATALYITGVKRAVNHSYPLQTGDIMDILSYLTEMPLEGDEKSGKVRRRCSLLKVKR